jgi:Flp pilus assembly protein TadD
MADRTVTPDAALAAGLAIEGDLAADGALRLFYLAAATQATGRLVLGTQGSQFALTFKKGTVAHALAEAPDLGVGAFLLQKGKLTAADLAKAEAAKPQAGGELVGALIALRLVNPADVAALLQEHGGAVIARALATEQGRFRWDPGMAPPASAFPLGSSWAFLGAAVRALDAGGAARRLGPRLGLAASRMGGRVPLEELRLTPQETRAVQLFDGARTVQALAAAHGGDSLLILRLALLLAESEMLSFAAPRAGAAAPPPAAPPPAATPVPAAAKPPASPAATPAPAKPPAAVAPAKAAPATTPAPTKAAAPPVAAKPVAPPKPPPPAPKPAAAPPKVAAPAPASAPGLDLKALQAMAEKFKTADFFEVLGVKREAGGPQIKIAYFQLAKAYHPDAVPADAPAELRKAAADVFAKISEAWGELGDDAKRAKYLDDLKTGAGTEVDVMHIFKAEEAFNNGTLLVKARRYQEALAKLDEAVKLNPDEAEFSMWKSWCEFLLSAEKKKTHAGAASAIEAALKKNPRCVSGYLFLGQMAKIVGDLATAEKQLKRGLKESPGNTDLERELKYLKK